MLRLIALILVVAGGWLGWRDWQSTIGQGNAFRLSSVEATWEAFSPSTHEAWLPMLQELTVPYLWDPVLKTLLVLPSAGLLIFIGAVLWMSRRRRRKVRGIFR